MEINKLKEIYEQVREKTKRYNQFMVDADERVSKFGGLGFHDHSTGFAMQVTERAYDQMDKRKMENFLGELSESGYIHASFDYEGISVVVCFSPEEVKKWATAG